MKTFPPTRRGFLRLLGGAAAGEILHPWARAAEEPAADLVTVSILHTTDLHGHILPTTDYHGRPDVGGLARCASQINAWRRENPNSLLLDIGDVYQGTEFALADRGRSMIDLFNLLRYDAWLVGNHEFDWGVEPFQRALERSQIPVLAANVWQRESAKIQPFLLRQIAGFKIAVVGLATPGMPFWFPSPYLGGFEFIDPVEPARQAIAQAKAAGADAIVLAGHMGLKERTGGDDFANRAMALTGEFPEAAVFIAGHTHQDVPARLTNGVLFTQADHFGIHAGRIDLVFDRASRKLLHTSSRTELMDNRIALDPVVLSRTQPQLDRADAVLATPVGELAENLSIHASPGEPSGVERLIAAAITEALANRGVKIDGVFHGLFEDKHVFKKGRKTIGDIWEILPYENCVVTGELLPNELRAVLDEVLQSRESRSLAGFRLTCEGQGSSRRLTSLSRADGRLLHPTQRLRIAFNTFDAASGGHRFLKLRELIEHAESHRTDHPVQTREALIEYFRHHQVVRLS